MSRRTPREAETVEIIDLSDDFRGVAHPPGKVMMIHGALQGETVRVRRMRGRRGHDEAALEAVIEPAAERGEPGCIHFDICGGCSIQHMSPPAQRVAKEARLMRLFEAAGVCPAERYEPLAGPEWGYRRRARLGVRYVQGKGRVLVGFRERFKPYIAVLERCRVLRPPADGLLEPLSELIGSLSLFQRLPQVEVSVADNRTALVFRVLDPPTPDDLLAMQAFERVHDVDVYLQTGGPGTISPLTPPAKPLVYSLPGAGLEFHFAPAEFIQVNADVNEKMVARAVELLAPVSGMRVLDLFCGLGNFSLALARAGASVTGVEAAPELVERARSNARHNGIENAEFFAADLFEDVSGQPWASAGYDAVLLDPARAGAGPVLATVAAAGAQRIVYVSCNPETLATDAGRLVNELGYELVGAGIIDMFPHTNHVESIALFERKS